VAGIATIDASPLLREAPLLIVDDPAIFPRSIPAARAVTSFSGYFGHTAANSAFQTLGGLLSLSAGRALGSVRGAAVGGFDSAATLRTSCESSASILIKRSPSGRG
jgi:hypothetical protein